MKKKFDYTGECLLVCISKEYEEEKENEEEIWFYIADKLSNMMIHVTRDDCMVNINGKL